MGSGIHIRTAILLLSIAAGCSDTATDIPITDPVCISAAICDQTRTSMSGSTASFAANDQIGIFETLTGRSNVSYTYGAPSWSTTTPMYWYNGSSNHTFYGYYPYTATYSGLKAGIPVLSTQTISTSPAAASDLLVAGPTTQKRGANVPLSFYHAFALIQLNIKMGVLQIINPFFLNRITIRGGNSTGSNPYGLVNITGTPTQVGYDFAAKAIWAASNNSQCYAQSFYSDTPNISLLTTAITLYAFVLPGTYSNPAPAISFRITTLLIPHNTDFEIFNTTTFQPGTKYVYNVTIGLLTRSSAPNVTIAPAEIVPWDDTTIE